MTSAGEGQIRLAVVEDLDAILLLDRAIENLPHWPVAEYRTALVETWQRCLFVAEVEGRLVGVAVGVVTVIAGECSAELETVGIAESARRQGLGRQLCVAVISWSQARGAVRLDLEVRSQNPGAIALYRELEFESVGVRKGYYRNPVDDAVLMRRELDVTHKEGGGNFQPKG
jgi:ribosomal-protein-alanine N-acetyltransferase